MPHIPTTIIGNKERPTDKPHLGVANVNGAFYPIVPGNVLAFIEDPANASKIPTVVLVSVDHKKIVVKCACGQPECSRSAVFRASWQGRHPRVER